MPRCLVALGSNVGDRAGFLARAIDRLGANPGISALRSSGLLETPAIGGADAQSPFLNAAVALDARLSPEELYRTLQQIERALGRQRGERWDPRTIDLDLLLFGDAVIDTPELVVPHPRMAFRRFVLEPAVEVAADMTHPLIGWTLRRLLEHLNTHAPYVALLGLPGSGKTAMAGRVAAAFGGRAILDPPLAAGGPAGGAAGPDCRRQIEFLERRAGVLDRRQPFEGGMLAVSDFYFDQCLAYAGLVLGAEEMETFRGAWRAARDQLVLPKLLVVLDTPRAGGSASEATAAPVARTDARLAGALVQDRLRDELLGLAARPFLGPVLHAGTDPRVQFLEISAAVQAMQ